MGVSQVVERCILCGSIELEALFDLGDLPLPNALPLIDDLDDARYPLDVVMCLGCGHVQLGHAVPPLQMFKHYTYTPSTSQFLQDHFKQTAADIFHYEALSPGDIVLDIGSNDGLLLSYFKGYGITPIGVDPAENLIAAANERGIISMPYVWNQHTAEMWRNAWKLKSPRVITATNCLAHTSELMSFLVGVRDVLSPNGAFYVEVPYLMTLLASNRFDTIYHEHQSYMAVGPLWRQLPKLGLRLDRCETLPDVHGGSMRLTIRHEDALHHVVRDEEKPRTWAAYEDEKLVPLLESFVGMVETIGTQLKPWLLNLPKPVYGIGASAKASIVLNYCNIVAGDIVAVADASKLKQGRAVPGARIPIVPEEELANAKTVVNFIWNLESDVKDKMKRFAPQASVVNLLEGLEL